MPDLYEVYNTIELMFYFIYIYIETYLNKTYKNVAKHKSQREKPNIRH